MPLTQVKSVIQKFVQNDKNELLAIKGKWGAGKTFFWNKTVKESSNKGEIKHEYYSYISLFGIDSLESLKNTILANQISSLSIGKDIDVSSSAIFSKIKNILKYAERVPYLRGFSGGLGSEFAFLFVRNCLVCFDDLERGSDKVDVKDILGLASFLKEQRNCKIVFILNDEKLEGKKQFDENSEKLVDLEINFLPTTEEVFDYVFNTQHLYFELIKFSCLTLQVQNIRILQRIKRFIDTLTPHLFGIEQNIVDDVIRSIILFVSTYYNKDSGLFTFEFLENYDSIDLYVRQNSRTEKVSEEEEKKHEILSKYRYGKADELDKQLMLFVQKGFLNETFFDELKLRNEQAIAEKGKGSHSLAWIPFRESFNVDEKVFVENLISSFRSNVKYLNIGDLYNIVDVLRLLNKNEPANLLIDQYLPQLINFQQWKELQAFPHYAQYKDPYFLEKLNNLPKPSTLNVNFEEALEILSSENEYFGEMVSQLAAYEEIDYYDFFKNETSSKIYYSTKYLLKFKNIENSNTENQIIFDKTKNALLKLASESLINKVRIANWFGLQMDSD